jgi:hypothetical protein
VFQACRRAAAGKEIYVSDLIPDALTGRPVVGVMIPVPTAGPSTWCLGIVIDPCVPQQILVEQDLPPGWWTTLSDRHGMVIARSVDPAHWVGRLLPPDVREVYLHNPEGEAARRAC